MNKSSVNLVEVFFTHIFIPLEKLPRSRSGE